LGKIFNTIKKSLSKKSVNSEQENENNRELNVINENCNSNENISDIKTTKQINNELEDLKTYGAKLRRRNHSYDRTTTKSHIYTDLNELNIGINSLFDYVLVVGLKDRKSYSTDELDSDYYINKVTTAIQWQFPADVIKKIISFC
jgi:hypothetical protein